MSNSQEEYLAVIREAEYITGSADSARIWFYCHKIDAFDGKRAASLVAEGRSSDVIAYIRSLSSGFSG